MTFVVLDFSTSDHAYSGQHVRARSALPRASIAPLMGCRRPLLMGVLANERGQDLHHRGMVSRGVTGDALERVNAANAHVKLVGAELLNSPGKAVRHLPLLSDFVGTPEQGEIASVQCTFHAVNTSAPAANKPAPSVSNWVRTASRAT